MVLYLFYLNLFASLNFVSQILKKFTFWLLNLLVHSSLHSQHWGRLLVEVIVSSFETLSSSSTVSSSLVPSLVLRSLVVVALTVLVERAYSLHLAHLVIVLHHINLLLVL